MNSHRPGANTVLTEGREREPRQEGMSLIGQSSSAPEGTDRDEIQR